MQPFESIQDRRKASIWTRIHPIFAIGQLGVFVVSVVLLVLFYFHLASFKSVFLSVLIKIAFMIGATITGSLWEHDVYGPWWFAHEFFVEDVMTLNVLLLHIGFLFTAFRWPDNTNAVLGVLLFAYGVYALNVAQYVVQHRNQKQLNDHNAAAA